MNCVDRGRIERRKVDKIGYILIYCMLYIISELRWCSQYQLARLLQRVVRPLPVSGGQQGHHGLPVVCVYRYIGKVRIVR